MVLQTFTILFTRRATQTIICWTLVRNSTQCQLTYTLFKVLGSCLCIFRFEPLWPTLFMISLHWVFPPRSHFFPSFSLAQSLSHVQLLVTPCTACSTPGFPALHASQSLLKLMSIEWVMSFNLSSSVTPFSSCPQSFPAQFTKREKNPIGRGHLFPKHLWSSLRIHWWSKQIFAASMSSKGYIY